MRSHKEPTGRTAIATWLRLATRATRPKGTIPHYGLLVFRHYRGVARDVVAKSVDGRTGRFPANVLRPFVTPDGVAGAFVLVYDEKNKFVEMRRVGD